MTKRLSNVLVVVTSCDKLAPRCPAGVAFDEFALLYLIFKQEGFAVTVASPKGGCVPIDPKSKEKTLLPEFASALADLQNSVRLSDIEGEQFDAIVLPGGYGGLIDLATDQLLTRLLMNFLAKKKLIAALSHGPAGLANALTPEGRPLVFGRNVTGFSNAEEKILGMDSIVPYHLEDRLIQRGACYQCRAPWTDHVIVDGNLVSGQNGQSSLSFAKAVIARLMETSS